MKLLLIAPLLFINATAFAAEEAKPFDLPIRAGKVEEVCMPLKQGLTLRWKFSADTPVDFNLHHHVGKEVSMPVDHKAVSSGDGEHRIERSNDWCLMWTAPKDRAARVRGSWSAVAP